MQARSFDARQRNHIRRILSIRNHGVSANLRHIALHRPEVCKHSMSQQGVVVQGAEVCNRVLTKTARAYKCIVTVPAVYQDVFRFLRGQPMQLGRGPEEALDRSHLSDATESITPVLAASGTVPVDDDPGYLNMAEIEDSALDTLDAALAAGQFPEFTRVRIL